MNERRRALQKIRDTGVLAATLPASWVKPIVKSIVLPAHAQTSAFIFRVGTFSTPARIFGRPYSFQVCVDFRDDKSVIFRYEGTINDSAGDVQAVVKYHGEGNYNSGDRTIKFIGYPCSDNDGQSNNPISVEILAGDESAELIIVLDKGFFYGLDRRSCSLSPECLPMS